MNANFLLKYLTTLFFCVVLVLSCRDTQTDISNDPEKLPVLSTLFEVTEIMDSSAASGGFVTDDRGETVTARGVCWSTHIDPTIKDSFTVNGSGVGAFKSTMKNLQPNTSYYVRAYATNAAGTAYGSALNFKTLNLPVVKTISVGYITNNNATVEGVVSEGIGESVLSRGVCWSTHSFPTIKDSLTTISGGVGAFTSILKNLKPNTQYYVSAYATNSMGAGYGNVMTFSTMNFPDIKTIAVSNIVNTTAVCGGVIVNNSGWPITACGVCWSTSPNPTIDLHTKTNNGTNSGVFKSYITNLTYNTTYYVRAYVSCEQGTNYGEELQFATTSPITAKDVDGNVYPTITIAGKTWMVENLRTRRYRDGSSIANITDNTQWAASEDGAYCSHNNTPLQDTKYGYLYNWFAVVDSRGIAPEGWHVATDAEWSDLETYLIANGYNYDGSVVGNKIAKSLVSTTGWISSVNIGVPGNELSKNNGSGFSAFPAGSRSKTGKFNDFGYYGGWWTSTERDSLNAFSRVLFYSIKSLNRETYITTTGLSVRCVMD